MKRSLVFLFIGAINIGLLNGQSKAQRIQELQNQTGAIVSLNRATKIPAFIRFPYDRPFVLQANTAAQATQVFLQAYSDIFSISDFEQDLQLEETKVDNVGFQHLVYQQSKNGVPVFDGILKFHYDSQNRLRAVNGVVIPDIKVSTIPNISEETAANHAISFVAGQSDQPGAPLIAISEKLYLFKKGLVQGQDGPTYLVYKVDVSNGYDIHEFIYVDAHTGKIVEQFTGTHQVLDRKIYEVSQDSLLWQDNDTFPGNLDIWQRNEVLTAGHSYHFFFHAFEFDSYNNAGATMRTINNGGVSNCPNANWNGSTTNFCQGLATDDVIAHEWAHAYTQYTNDLIYAWQSGALNESYSDIWGETIDLLNGYEDDDENLTLRTGCSSSHRWRIGEDASAFGGAIRDMWDPTCKAHPGKVSDNQYHCSEGDNGGVHRNSGINNHAYALLVDGGTYNNQTINGLGFTKAAHIFWRSQNAYLTATSDFTVQADALEASCSDLIGIDLIGLSTSDTTIGLSGEMITLADLQELQKVLAAVEMRMEPPCNHVRILDEISFLCLQSMPDSAIFKEDFESGLEGWTVTQLPENPETWETREWELNSNLPDLRPGTGIFGPDPINGNCIDDLQNGIIRLESPLIEIPSDVTGDVELAFYHYIATESFWDGGNIKYSLDDGAWTLIPASAFSVNGYNATLNTNGNDNPIAAQSAFTGSDAGTLFGSWGRSVINLSLLQVMAGSDFRIRFELGTDGCNGRIGWYLDDITIYNCACSESLNLASTLNSQQLLLESEVSIMSTDTITGSSHIIYSAGEELNFVAGFEINTGSQMEARMEGCSTMLLNHGSTTPFSAEQSQEVYDYSSLNTLLINGNRNRSEKMLLQIFSITGVFIGQTDFEVGSNSPVISIPLISTLSKGLYQAKFSSKDSTDYFKFVID